MVLKSGSFHPITSASKTVKPHNNDKRLGSVQITILKNFLRFSSQINLLMVQRSKMTLSSKGEGFSMSFHGNGGKTAASLTH